MKIKNTCLNPRHPNTSGILLGVLSEPENMEVALDVDRGIVLGLSRQRKDWVVQPSYMDMIYL